MDTTPGPPPGPLQPAPVRLADVLPLHRPAPRLPLWQIQLIHAAMDLAEELNTGGHTCTIAPGMDLGHCEPCLWQALYDQIPAGYRRAAIAEVAAGVPTLPPSLEGHP